ncbi:hypothetical protein K435DRAFT_790831 [Dendrothele bispora CBS 962.96]|uniref:Uncharacterized protein n=1 Tax=Dendrothele bispora (strain CBS 962.96) TaxID=1314807 RepID=A0A4S8MQM6_DENBC|nr:hypothetical protein K435DRAFT_790831 [Dendrothele bispora CBS 962.96]
MSGRLGGNGRKGLGELGQFPPQPGGGGGNPGGASWVAVKVCKVVDELRVISKVGMITLLVVSMGMGVVGNVASKGSMGSQGMGRDLGRESRDVEGLLEEHLKGLPSKPISSVIPVVSFVAWNTFSINKLTECFERFKLTNLYAPSYLKHLISGPQGYPSTYFVLLICVKLLLRQWDARGTLLYDLPNQKFVRQTAAHTPIMHSNTS